LVSPDGVAPSRMVSVSASVNLPLHHKVQKFSSGTGSPGWSRKKSVKRLWCGVVVVVIALSYLQCLDILLVVRLAGHKLVPLVSKCSVLEQDAGEIKEVAD